MNLFIFPLLLSNKYRLMINSVREPLIQALLRNLLKLRFLTEFLARGWKFDPLRGRSANYESTDI